MSRRAAVSQSYGGVSAEARRQDRRLRLVTAARELWGESGVGAVTVRGVCARAGLTDRYFYEQFENSEALVLAVADDVRDQLLTAMVSAGLSATGPEESRLAGALRGFLDPVADDPQILRILTTDESAVPGLAERHRGVLALIADLVIEHSPNQRRANTAATRDAAVFAVGGVNSLIERWLGDSASPVTTDELATTCARLCVAVLHSAE